MRRRISLFGALLALACASCTPAVIHDTRNVAVPVTVYPVVPPVVDPTLPTLPDGAPSSLVVRTAILREQILKTEMDARGKELNGLRHSP